MRLSVLLVEDDPTLMAVVAEALVGEGFDVIKAGDGDTAVELFINEPERFALLFTNVQLPGQTQGGDLARIVRTRRPRIPVMIASGNPDVFEASWTEEDGYHVLRKPYRLQELQALARELADAGRDQANDETSQLIAWTASRPSSALQSDPQSWSRKRRDWCV